MRTRFEYRRWWVIDASPAQFGGLVEALIVLHATDEALQWLLGGKQPFHVYGLPLADNAPVVTVRYPGGGEIGEKYRDPRYGWIDAMARLDGKTDLVLAYNFSTPVLPLEKRLYLWQLLFDWLEESGCPVMAIDDAAPAVTLAPARSAGIAGEETTGPAAGIRKDREQRRADVRRLLLAKGRSEKLTAFRRRAASELAVSESTIRDDLRYLRETGQT